MSKIIDITKYVGGENMIPDIIDVANYFVKKGIEDNIEMTPLKLQKMCYYVKALSLVRNCDLLKNTEFRAWVHGPANWDLYRKYVGYYKNTRISTVDCIHSGNIFNKSHLNILNDIYSKFKHYSGEELERRTHGELPWKEARKGLYDYQNGDRLISENTMKEYYTKVSIV